MRVLHIVPDLSPASGGPVSVALGMAAALESEGLDVRLFATEHGLDEIPEVRGCRLRLFPCRLCAWRYAPELARALRDEVRWADLVHIHTLWKHPTLAASRACRRAGVPYVLRPAGMLEAWSLRQRAWKKKAYLALFERTTIAGCRALHWTSEAERDASGDLGRLAPPLVLAPGLPPAAYADLPGPADFLKRFPRLAGRRIVLFLGRLHPKKQPDIALRALAKIRNDFPDTVLVLAGPGEARYVAGLEALASSLLLDGAAVFTGLLRGREVQEAMAAASVFVLPSLQENFGVAVAEAMAAACPVVVSRAVALAALVERRGAGLVCAPSPEGLGGALHRILTDEEARREMGRRGRQAILEELTWDVVGPRLVEAYAGLLRGAA